MIRLVRTLEKIRSLLWKIQRESVRAFVDF